MTAYEELWEGMRDGAAPSRPSPRRASAVAESETIAQLLEEKAALIEERNALRKALWETLTAVRSIEGGLMRAEMWGSVGNGL